MLIYCKAAEIRALDLTKPAGEGHKLPANLTLLQNCIELQLAELSKSPKVSALAAAKAPPVPAEMFYVMSTVSAAICTLLHRKSEAKSLPITL